ncbi:YijD family membrane protein [Enterovibrio calviensis]|uniref:YijD family membrane protein n=1 Tax=Enterovibrio calviensis TaxID=91359 RepID=UPI0037352A5C
MEQNHQSERKFLLLAVLAGLCGSATLATLFIDSVAFSIFPVIAFVLSVYCFYQQHVNQPLTEGTPLIAFACFLVGAFGYSAFVRMQIPELGGNFFSIIVTMLLVFWVAQKMGWFAMGKKEETVKE